MSVSITASDAKPKTCIIERVLQLLILERVTGEFVVFGTPRVVGAESSPTSVEGGTLERVKVANSLALLPYPSKRRVHLPQGLLSE